MDGVILSQRLLCQVTVDVTDKKSAECVMEAGEQVMRRKLSCIWMLPQMAVVAAVHLR